MPRDMTGTARYAPQPLYPPFAFYSAVRLGDPEMLARIMQVDPYFVTQDNGAGAPLHFAVTYCNLDMAHHLINVGAEVNQRDPRGLTPLHRAAYLAHLPGYIELYEYLLSRGADPSIESEVMDAYLDPYRNIPREMAGDEMQEELEALECKYAGSAKVWQPHPDVGDWWALYDYGLDTIKSWPVSYRHPYPEERMRQKLKADQAKARAERRQRRDAFLAGDLSVAEGATKAMVLEDAPPSDEVTNSPIAFLFPGQGSQAVGMLGETKDLPAVKAMLETAKSVLGYDLLEVCLNGPKDKLDETVHSQPALFIAGLAAVEALRVKDPQAVARCSAAAGLSLGEFTALVFAGAMSFEDGLKVVKVRAERMTAAAKAGSRPHGMLSVVGLLDADLEGLCREALASSPSGSICSIANYLFPQGRVLSGHLDVLEKVRAASVAQGALKATILAVSGAFHTQLMQPAQAALIKVLADVTIKAPRIPVLSNVTAAAFGNADDIRQLLQRQLVEPVRWEDSLASLVGGGKNKLYELGPGAQIKAMVKRLNVAVWRAVVNVAP